ncbi:hypothetical protein ABZ806_07150 [Spirillospora sp. NPDC047418]
MRTWSDSPFPRLVRSGDVEGYDAATVVARDNGESSVIHEAPGHPGWLVKRYKPAARIGHIALDDLIELPGQMSAGDLALVDRSIAWPVSRVVDGYRTVGTLMARADDAFTGDVALLQGRTRRQTIEVDLLANADRDIERLGLPVPTPALRLAAMREIVAVAALFERHGLVYGDWSFANAFWAPGTDRVLVIDMDTVRMGRRDHLETHNWDDPLADESRPLTTHTDRYKVALLVARTTTGLRQERGKAVERMAALYPRYPDLIALLAACVDATEPEARPRLEEILSAMDGPAATGSRIGGGRTGTGARPRSGTASAGGRQNHGVPSGANVTGTVPWRPNGGQAPKVPSSVPRPPSTPRRSTPAGPRTAGPARAPHAPRTSQRTPSAPASGASAGTPPTGPDRSRPPERTGSGCSPVWIVTVLLLIAFIAVIALRS